MARPAQPSRNRDCEDVLNLMTVYLHTKAGEGVRLHGQGRFKLGLKNHRPFGQTDDDVRTPAVVQRPGNRRQVAPFPKESGERIVDDAFVAAVFAIGGRHAKSESPMLNLRLSLGLRSPLLPLLIRFAQHLIVSSAYLEN